MMKTQWLILEHSEMIKKELGVRNLELGKNKENIGKILNEKQSKFRQ